VRKVARKDIRIALSSR